MDQDQIKLPTPDDLVGDPQLTAARIPGLRAHAIRLETIWINQTKAAANSAVLQKHCWSPTLPGSSDFLGL